MKKLLVMLLALAMMITCIAMTACTDTETPDDQGQQGDTPDTPDEPAHTHAGGEATCTAKAKCADCGEEYGDLADHDYDKKGICKVCEAKDPEVEAEEKAAAEAAAPVIELIKGLEGITEITEANLADSQAKYNAANDAYNALDKNGKDAVGKDNKAVLTAVKNLIKDYETAIESVKAAAEWKETVWAALPQTKIANATITIDGEFDNDAMNKCTPMTLTREQCGEWNDEGRKDGAGVVGDTTLTEGAETDISFYVMYDNDYLYVVEWRCDLNWNFSAQDFKKSYTGDGSLLWFVNTGDAATWIANGGSVEAGDKPAFGMMWNAGIGGEKPGENKPQIAYFPEDDQSAPDEKTASGKWNYALKWDADQYYYVLEVAIPWADVPFTFADMDAGNISATYCSVDIVNPEFDGDSGKLWAGMGYQMQFPGVNNWCLSQPLIPNK